MTITIDERKCILLVDDDLDEGRVLNKTLKHEGFNTITVTDDDKAMNFLRNIKPDMVILDEVKPDRDSINLVDRIRQHSDVPIIMLDQVHGIEALRRAFSHGADDYIEKPFRLSALVARVRAKIRRAGYRKIYAPIY